MKFACRLHQFVCNHADANLAVLIKGLQVTMSFSCIVQVTGEAQSVLRTGELARVDAAKLVA